MGKDLEMKHFAEGLTFDDVIMIPAYSEVLPSECCVKTNLTKEISLNIPLISAAMDTVTESSTAMCIAREGGLGIIHKNMSPQEQALEVTKVKKAESGIVVDPITVLPSCSLREALGIMRSNKISGLPVVKNNQIVGIVTNRDVRFEKNLDGPVSHVMTKKLITAPEGISVEESKRLLHKNRIEKLLVVDEEGKLAGLITIKDIEKALAHPMAAKDSLGRLRVGAAVGVGADLDERLELLLDADVDLLVVDTAHGHSKKVGDTVTKIKKTAPHLNLIAGNIATPEGFKYLVDAGADGVKVGVGPGSICTTRIVAGVGVPQMSAVLNCAEVSIKTKTPLIADGGVRYSGDVVKALAAGAHTVMVGSLFAGTDEAPGEVILYQGRSYKVYRGMGSIGAMKAGSSDRYGQEGKDSRKLVPEGIEGRVPYRGSLSQSITQLVGGVKSGMGYTGCKTLPELRKKIQFIRLSPQGLRESHVHDVIITKEAPNYGLE